jgi:hypothetical protein
MKNILLIGIDVKKASVGGDRYEDTESEIEECISCPDDWECYDTVRVDDIDDVNMLILSGVVESISAPIIVEGSLHNSTVVNVVLTSARYGKTERFHLELWEAVGRAAIKELRAGIPATMRGYMRNRSKKINGLLFVYPKFVVESFHPGRMGE